MRNRRVTTAAIVVTMAALVSACGGGSDDGESSADGAASAAPTGSSAATAPTAEASPTTEAAEVLGTLRIGVAYPDVEAFATLNEKFSIGDPEEQIEAVLDGWRRAGLLPVNGYDLELIPRKYRVINTDDKLGVCTTFAQDDEVFAVISGRDFTVGAECLASRYQIPVIDLAGAPPSVYERGAPWLFTLRAGEAEVLINFVDWAEAAGSLEGHRIGVFWDTRSEESVDAFKAALAERGYEVAVEVASDGEGVGSPQDEIAVQQFVAADVDAAVLLVGTSSVINFMTFAERQGYRPTYLELEYASHLGDVASSALPPEQFDGTKAMTISRVGELAAGLPVPEQTESCVANYEQFSGKSLPRTSPETGEYTNLLYTCDLMSVLLAGLQGAGPDMTSESLVAALEGISDFPLSAWGNLSFGPGDHAGVQQYRTIGWSVDCVCWTAEGDLIDFGG